MSEAAVVGGIDEPAEGAKLPVGRTVVRGWFASGGKPALAVAITIDGEYAGHCRIGNQRRPDVAAAQAEPRLAGSGWSVPIELNGRPGTSRRLVVNVWPAPTTPPVRFERSVWLIDPQSDSGHARTVTVPFVGGVDLPEEGAELAPGYVRVAGWVLGPDGPIQAVRIVANGKDCGRARLGLPRADVAASEPVPHAVISGYEAFVDLRQIPVTGNRVTFDVVAVEAGRASAVVATRSVTVAKKRAEHSSEARSIWPPHDRRDKSSEGQLKLVVFAHHLGFGGAQLWLSEFLRLSGAGRAYACTVVAPAKGALMEELHAMGISTHITQNVTISDAATYKSRIDELVAWIRSHRFNAALVNTLPNFLFAAAAVSSEIPTVWAIHESWTPDEYWLYAFPDNEWDSLVALRAREALRQAHAVAFVAEATRRRYDRAVGVGRSVVVPYGIDVDMIDEYCNNTSTSDARRQLGLPEDMQIVLSVGTIEPRKCQSLIAAAFRAITAHDDRRMLVIVGDAGGIYVNALRQYVDAAGLADRAMVVPVVSDPRPWYRAADVFVCAADVESFPRTLLEAMAFGLPVIATSVFGIPEFVQDGETGLVYEADDFEELKSTLEHVMHMGPKERAVMAEAGRYLIRTRYRSDDYVADITGLLEGLRETPRATPYDVLVRRGSDRWRIEAPIPVGNEPPGCSATGWRSEP